MRPLFLLISLLFSLALTAQNQYPEINNFAVSIDDNNQMVTITYDLFDAEGDVMDIQLQVSDNDGQSYLLDTSNATGDVGSAISSGNGKSISWDASGQIVNTGSYFFKLIADDLFQMDIQSIVDQVDSVRLLNTLQTIEGIRHRNTNPTHLENIKDTIQMRMQMAGIENYREDFSFNTYTAQNIIGRMEGTTHNDSTYIIDGHFDTVDDSPGADDNGSAVAGMLEALRVLAPYRFHKTLRFIGFDLEEEGLLGSLDYTANSIPDTETIKGVFNLEMIGYYSNEPNSQIFPNGFEILYPDVQAALVADEFRGNFITNIGDQNSLALMAAYNNAAAQYVPELKVISLDAPDGWLVLTPDLGRSDHAAFWLQEIPALMLTDGSEFRNPFYHSPDDLVETLDFTFMSHVVKAVVAAVAEEAGITHSTTAIEAVAYITNLTTPLQCDLHLSPIPTQEHLQLRFEHCDFENLELRIFDMFGKLLLEKEIQPNTSGTTALSLGKLNSGIYLLELRNKEETLSRKIVVE